MDAQDNNTNGENEELKEGETGGDDDVLMFDSGIESTSEEEGEEEDEEEGDGDYGVC